MVAGTSRPRQRADGGGLVSSFPRAHRRLPAARGGFAPPREWPSLERIAAFADLGMLDYAEFEVSSRLSLKSIREYLFKSQKERMKQKLQPTPKKGEPP